MLAGRGRPYDLGAGEPRELHEQRPHAARGPVHEHGLPGTHPCGAVEHLPGGDPVGHGRDRVGGIQRRGDRRHVLCVERHAVRPCPGLRQSGDPGAEKFLVDALADRFHLADQVVPRHEGELRLTEVAALEHLNLGEGDPRRLDADHDLPVLRAWQVLPVHFEHLRSAFVRHHYLGPLGLSGIRHRWCSFPLGRWGVHLIAVSARSSRTLDGVVSGTTSGRRLSRVGTAMATGPR